MKYGIKSGVETKPAGMKVFEIKKYRYMPLNRDNNYLQYRGVDIEYLFK